jgi:hypothetical protein
MDNFVSSCMSPYINREKIPDYIQDIPDFLCQIEHINERNDNSLPPTMLLQTQDVQVMYPSIDVDECVAIWVQILTEEGSRNTRSFLGIYKKKKLFAIQ